MRSGSVEFRGITKRYDQFKAVDNVDLTINAGEFLSLLGPSGSGKTTLLMMLAGFSSPTSGEILVDGQRIDKVPANRRNQGVVFQSYALFPHMTVRENIGFPLKARGIAGPTAAGLISSALARVRMKNYAERYPSQLSGGQQQRVALARAIVFDPPLVLMDESLSALDRKLREEMRSEIKDLHSELGKTIIYVTHDQEEALTMSNRVVVLREGRIAQVGTPLDIYEQPLDTYVAGFVGQANFFSGSVACTTNGVATVDLASGSVRALSPEPLRTGQPATVMVRPEAVKIAKAGSTRADESHSVLSGKMIQVVFLGDSFQYRIQTGDQEVVAKVSRSESENLFSRGDDVDVIIHARKARLYDDTRN